MIVTRENRTSLHALLIGGYLLIWASFGVVAHLLDQTLHWQLGNWTWFAMHPWAPAAAVLAVAGAFQFSRLKYRCLDKCRTPLNFIMSHWHGPRPAWESFNLGVAHGVYWVGCCWALMLLMFVVGTGNIGWMLALGLLMALEKNHPWGRSIAAPLGVSLLTLAALITATGTGMILG
jgi:predicted metal-binding membrane protein